jgi:hypothetical protein
MLLSKDQGFLLGLAFRRGFEFGARKKAALDSGEKWITVTGTHVKVVGGRLTGRVGQKIERGEKKEKVGAKRNVRPEDLPTIDQFRRENRETLDGAKQQKIANLYIRHLLELTGKSSVVCNGEYQGSPIVATFTSASIDEMCSKLNDSGEKSLPYMFDVMETGAFFGVVTTTKEQHLKKGIERFAYFRKTVTIDGKPTTVQVDVALMRPGRNPRAKPYVQRVRKEGSELSYPLKQGGISSKPSSGEDSSQSLLATNIARDSELFNFVPFRVRIVA